MLGARPSIAGPSDSAAKSKEFHAAYAAFEANDMSKAYRILAALVAKNPAFDAVTLLGQTELSLEKYRDAAMHLEYGLRHTPKGKFESAAPMIRADLAEAKKHIVTLTIKVIQADAEVTIDGESVGKSPILHEIYVNPERHTIRAAHPTLGSGELTMDFRAGDDLPITLRLTSESVDKSEKSTVAASEPTQAIAADTATKENEPSPAPPARKSDGLDAKTIVLIVGGAVTLAAGVTTTVFGLKASNAGSEHDEKLSQAEQLYGPRPCSVASAPQQDICAAVAAKDSERVDAARVFNVMLPLTVGSALATGILYVLWPAESKNAAYRTRISPMAGKRSAGLSLEAVF